MSNPIVWPVAPALGIVLQPGTGGGTGNPTDPITPVPTAPLIPPTKFITRDYTLVPADILGTIVATSNLPITITIPEGMPSGRVTIVQGGPGIVTLVGADGVVVDTPPGKRPSSAGVNSTMEAFQLTGSLWLVGGVALAQPLPPDIYYGASPTTALTAQNIPTIGQGKQAASLPVTVTYDNTGGRYPFIAYPASWPAITAAKIGAFTFSDLVTTEVQMDNGLGQTVPYRVVRFNGIQNGANMEVTW